MRVPNTIETLPNIATTYCPIGKLIAANIPVAGAIFTKARIPIKAPNLTKAPDKTGEKGCGALP